MVELRQWRTFNYANANLFLTTKAAKTIGQKKWER